MANATILATTLLALIGVVSALCINSSSGKEGFAGLGHSFTFKTSREVSTPNGMMSVPGLYQADISPRMSNVGYGAAIRYNPPDRKHMAVPVNPVEHGNLAVGGMKENFSGPKCGPSGANKGSVYGMTGIRNMPEPNYKAPGHKAAESKLQTFEVTSALPVSTMVDTVTSGATSQAVVYDRFMYANQKSRLYGAQDHFRGMPPIVPNLGGWFNVAVNPNIDLNTGALAVMGGLNNETQKETMGMISAMTGGLQQTMGGVNLGNQYTTEMGAGGADIMLSTFP
jgi:hypothetical protein